MENSTYTPQNITTIDEDIQRITINTADFHFKKLAESKVHNIAILVLDTESGAVLAYAGNTGLDDPNGKNAHVDMIQAKRSSGSLLKPFLFAGMLDAGLLLPDQLMIDVPTKIAGYTPENNSERYSGAVPAGEALSKSLNVPFVRALREFTIPAFLALLKKCGFTTFTRSADEYGLPLILGGGEITLYEAVNAYRLMMLKSQGKLKTVYPFSEGACSLTLEALIKGTRPEEEALWQSFSSAQKIAWKTGTSFGWRDAWSIGVTAKYSIGVWVGNASGEGRPEIRSGTAAAPILFTIFKLLQKSKWEPTSEIYFEPITVCAHSGYLAAQYCAQTKQAVKPLDAPSSRQCPYCRPVSLTKDGLFRILPQDIQGLPRIENRFSLPAGVEYFYAKLHPEYCPLPAWKKGSSGSYNSDFQLLFPEQGTQVLIPIELDGTLGAMTAKAVHKDPTAIIFWDIDGDYLGKTEKFHQWNIRVDSGSHILTLTDQNGNQIKRTFTVLKRRGN